MIVSINQPAYLPWAGYFDRIAASDVHIILDHVQFEKNSFINRNKIRTQTGWTWLTLPVATSGKFGDLPITELRTVDTGRSRGKHWNAIRANYGRAKFFRDRADFLHQFYTKALDTELFLPPVLELTFYLLRVLELRAQILRSSALSVTGSKSDLVLNLCKAVGATTYLSGPLGRGYLDAQQFGDANIAILYHGYEPQPYDQVWPGFEPAMSIIDLLMTHNREDALEIVQSGRQLVSSQEEHPTQLSGRAVT